MHQAGEIAKNILFTIRYTWLQISSKRKHFQLGEVKHLTLSALNTGIAGTSAPSTEGQNNHPIYSMLYRMPDLIKAKALSTVKD